VVAVPGNAKSPTFIADLGLPFPAVAGFNGPLPQTGGCYLVIYSAGGDYMVGMG
jgi:hypothetical protein